MKVNLIKSSSNLHIIESLVILCCICSNGSIIHNISSGIKSGIFYSSFWFMRRRIWSMAILQWNPQKNYELYHCFICNAILLVIQRNLTWNLLFIWFMRRRTWSLAILQWNLQKQYKLYHCFNCNTIFAQTYYVTNIAMVYIVIFRSNILLLKFFLTLAKVKCLLVQKYSHLYQLCKCQLFSQIFNCCLNT